MNQMNFLIVCLSYESIRSDVVEAISCSVHSRISTVTLRDKYLFYVYFIISVMYRATWSCIDPFFYPGAVNYKADGASWCLTTSRL